MGELLARRLDLPFRDSDAEIALIAGRSPDRILRESGESDFRSWERRAVSQLAALPAVVLSLGGGAAMQDKVRQDLTGWHVVLVDAPDPVLEQRILADRREGRATRPSLTALPLIEEIAELRRLRFTVFESFATLRVDTSRTSPDEIVERLLESIESPGTRER